MSYHTCSPYGAYELKSTYQRNLMLGNLMTTTAVLLVVGVAWLINALAVPPIVIPIEPDVIDGGVMGFVPLPTVKYDRPDFAPKPPPANNKGYIPQMVDDTMFIDDDNMIFSNEDLADWNGPGVGSDAPTSFEYTEPTGEGLPTETEFVPVDKQPEMIHEFVPKYPRLARRASAEGTVWIRALIDIEGKVIDAKVARSSGYQILDEAALQAAYKNEFSPAIRASVPVAIWVTYDVKFVLE